MMIKAKFKVGDKVRIKEGFKSGVVYKSEVDGVKYEFGGNSEDEIEGEVLEIDGVDLFIEHEAHYSFEDIYIESKEMFLEKVEEEGTYAFKLNGVDIHFPSEIPLWGEYIAGLPDKEGEDIINNPSHYTQGADSVKEQGHYTQFKIQPKDFIRANKLNWVEGNIVKYLRYKEKDGLKDLYKMKDYVEMLIEDFKKGVNKDEI